MRRVIPWLMAGLMCALATVLTAADAMPLWAYGYSAPPAPPGGPAPAAGGTGRGGSPAPDVPKTLTGAPMSFTRAQLFNLYGPADWFPNDHPPMPEIVAKGRQDGRIFACSLCHRAHGKGQPENAPVSGLPVSYFIQTMTDFKNGVRKSSDARKVNAGLMTGFAKAMTDAEIRAAADYFGAIKWTPWVTVRETNVVPKTHIANNLFLANEDGEKEPLGRRIIEVPENNEAVETLRDPRSGFIAYVPTGSIKKGEGLVTTGGGGRTIACGLCHGPDLKGVGPVPPIAGRSPSYLVRQLYDMQTGARNAEWTQLMKPVVSKLSDDDFINIAAYVASRP
jgi:cytochrome c553